MAEIVEVINNVCFEEPYKLFLLVGAAGLLASLFLQLKAKDLPKIQMIYGIIMAIGLVMKYGARHGPVDWGLVSKVLGAIMYVDFMLLALIACAYSLAYTAGYPINGKGWSYKHRMIFRNLLIALGAVMIVSVLGTSVLSVMLNQP